MGFSTAGLSAAGFSCPRTLGAAKRHPTRRVVPSSLVSFMVWSPEVPSLGGFESGGRAGEQESRCLRYGSAFLSVRRGVGALVLPAGVSGPFWDPPDSGNPQRTLGPRRVWLLS